MMEHDKSTWGDGPWQEEPDRVEFIHPSGLMCRLLRGNSGGWCGYVALPPSHPDFGKDYDNVDVSVHGGLTYSAKQAPGDLPDGLWWVGFDTAHAYDYMPAFAKRLAYNPALAVYRDMAYVKAEVEALAAQLAARKE